MAYGYKKPSKPGHKPQRPSDKPNKPGHKNMASRKQRTKKGRKLPASGSLEERLADKEM